MLAGKNLKISIVLAQHLNDNTYTFLQRFKGLLILHFDISNQPNKQPNDFYSKESFAKKAGKKYVDWNTIPQAKFVLNMCIQLLSLLVNYSHRA